jgi:hypothetical protein
MRRLQLWIYCADDVDHKYESICAFDSSRGVTRAPVGIGRRDGEMIQLELPDIPEPYWVKLWPALYCPRSRSSTRPPVVPRIRVLVYSVASGLFTGIVTSGDTPNGPDAVTALLERSV